MGEADHYKTLGLRRDASKAEVKAAFSRLALLHHPDRHVKADDATRADATRRFRQAYDAYHVLYDDARRADYDRRTSPFAWGGFGYGAGKSRSSSTASSSAKSRSSSASTGWFGSSSSTSSGWFGGASSSSYSDPTRYRYRYGVYPDFPPPTQRKSDESLGVWMRANWYPLLCCTLRVAELVVDGLRMYNNWKSSRQEKLEKEAEKSKEKEAAKSKEKMDDEPLEEEEYVVV